MRSCRTSMTHQHQHPNAEQIRSSLIAVLQQMVGELHPQQPPDVELGSYLDRDLGLDSTARMELLGRLEKECSLNLSEQALAEAETVTDLLNSLLKNTDTPVEMTEKRINSQHIDTRTSIPDDALTLVEALQWHLEHHPDQVHVRLYSDETEGETLTYRELWDGAVRAAAGLQWRGLKEGSAVAIMLATGKDYLFSFFGILLAGGIPVPLYPPVRRTQLENHLMRQRTILDNCQAVTLITMPEALVFARLLKAQLKSLEHLVSPQDLYRQPDQYQQPAIKPEDTAFLQYTSGSTGNPKGVVLSHANLLANIRALGKAVDVRPDDVIISWLPLYHDMGLIGTWLAGLYFAVPVVLMSPHDFFARPRRWLWAIHRYRGTLSPAPNFAYEICLNRIDDDELEGLDLSSWRGAFNGAEPVSAATLEKFCERFTAYGLRPEVLTPVYGLAENTVGLTFPPRGRKPLIDCIDRHILAATGTAVLTDNGEKGLRLVACGRPLDGHEVRIVDDSGQELVDRREGRVQFRGPSACNGYYRNPDATRQLFDGEWLNTGDRGYIADGDLYLTGRSKDLIIIGGRNLYPQELEEVVGTVSGVRKGNVAVFGSPDAKTGSEQLVIVAETRETAERARREILTQIKSHSVDLLGTPPDDMLLVPPHSILKTSSGKIRRSACRELYQRGALGKPEKPWRQQARMLLATLGGGGKRVWEKSMRYLYAGYLWSLFGLAIVSASLVILTLPRRRWNWHPLHLLARSFLRLSFLPVTIAGREKVPERENCVLVANHASFFDVYLMPATLPIPFAFVAKAELQQQPLVSFMLRRIGTQFVDRLDMERSLGDTKRLKQLAQSGQTLLFFPEGTFTRVAGLRGFRMGAFVTAAESDLPIVPIAISGTRSVLRDGSWFPRYGRISIQVGESIRLPEEKQQDDSWNQALWLHDAARAYILRHCGESDLRSQTQYDHLKNNVSSSS